MTHRIEETVARGICIGCGACSVATDGAVRVQLGMPRLYQADIAGADPVELRRASRVCPFSDEAANEDELGPPRHALGMSHSAQLGWYTRTFAGRITDESALLKSSSGGLTTWLLSALVRAGEVDSVIHVVPASSHGAELFEYAVSDPGEVLRGRKSQYYSVTMAEVMPLVERTEGRFAFVGIPCFVKAARLLCAERAELGKRISYFVGLVCGHLKSQAFPEALAWQLGISPPDLAEVDFRVKREGSKSSEYDFGARGRDDASWRYSPTRRLIGGNWGHNAFQPEACNFCDDVVAETADVSFGDAWLPQFLDDSRGTNVVVSRNAVVDGLFDDGVGRGEIEVVRLPPDAVVQSQAGGFRHRRDGLAIRLADDASSGLSVPRKRVAPNPASVSPRRAALFRQRRRMATLSHIAFAEARRMGKLASFVGIMKREIRIYSRLEASILRRCLRRLKRALRRSWS